MGDPKFPKKTYSTPRHPWQKERIDSEKELLKKFGLKNKRELWKGMEMLKSFRSQARDLQARMRANDPNAQNQFQRLITRLERYNILGHGASLDDVLSLTIEDILSRRLQTIVFRKNLARTLKQARQMITHGHVTMNGRRVTVPGMLVEGQHEEEIIYHDRSPFTDELHPIRQVILNGSSVQETEGEAEPEEKPYMPGRQQRPGRGYQRRDRSRSDRRERPEVESTPKEEKPKEKGSGEAPVKEEKPKVAEEKSKQLAERLPKEEQPKNTTDKIESKKEELKPEPKKEGPVKETKPKSPAKEERKEVRAIEEAPAKAKEPVKESLVEVGNKAPKPEGNPKEDTGAKKPKAAKPKEEKTAETKKTEAAKEEIPAKEEKPKKSTAAKTKTAKKPSSKTEEKTQEKPNKEEPKEGKQ